MTDPADSNPARSNPARFASYNIAGSSVLRNRLGITDAAQLREAEYQFTVVRSQSVPAVKATVQSFKAVHHHLFQDVYDWAGQFRQANMTLGGTVAFADWWQLDAQATQLFGAVGREARQDPAHSIEQFAERSSRLTGALNRMHPFREGNGRTMRSFLTGWAKAQGFVVDFEYMPRQAWVETTADAYHQRYQPLQALIAEQHTVSLRRAAEAASEIRRPRFDQLRPPDAPDPGLGR